MMNRFTRLIAAHLLVVSGCSNTATTVAWGTTGLNDGDGETEVGTDTRSDNDSNSTVGEDTDTSTDTMMNNVCPFALVGWAAVEGEGVTTTTGGGDAAPVRPATIDDLRTFAADGDPQVISVSGIFETGEGPLRIASNKTLVGLDADAAIIGGIEIDGVSNVIVQNLNIQALNDDAMPADAIAVNGSHHVWIDHCRISGAIDGNLDITDGSDFATVSWTIFSDVNQCSLVGGSSEDVASDTGKNNTTWHHNWFAENVARSTPRALFGKIHVFNSYYTAVDNSSCIASGSFAGVLIERNYFEGVNDPHIFADTNPAHITAVDNIYDNTSGSQEEGYYEGDTDGVEPFPSSAPYAYTPDPAADVPDLVTQCAGPQ